MERRIDYEAYVPLEEASDAEEELDIEAIIQMDIDDEEEEKIF